MRITALLSDRSATLVHSTSLQWSHEDGATGYVFGVVVDHSNPLHQRLRIRKQTFRVHVAEARDSIGVGDDTRRRDLKAKEFHRAHPNETLLCLEAEAGASDPVKHRGQMLHMLLPRLAINSDIIYVRDSNLGLETSKKQVHAPLVVCTCGL